MDVQTPVQRSSGILVDGLFSKCRSGPSQLKNVAKQEGGVTVLHMNVQSFKSKVEDVELMINKFCVDILCLSEHWLKNSLFIKFKTIHR